MRGLKSVMRQGSGFLRVPRVLKAAGAAGREFSSPRHSGPSHRSHSTATFLTPASHENAENAKGRDARDHLFFTVGRDPLPEAGLFFCVSIGAPPAFPALSRLRERSGVSFLRRPGIQVPVTVTIRETRSLATHPDTLRIARAAPDQATVPRAFSVWRRSCPQAASMSWPFSFRMVTETRCSRRT